MIASNSYPQLHKVIHSLWDSPNSTLNSATYLTYAVRSRDSGRAARRIARTGVIVLSAAYCFIGLTPESNALNTKSDIDRYKLYTHMKLISATQYECINLLWQAESKWNPRANNPKSTAYGIPQLLKLKTNDPYKQIELGLRYVKHRYGTACRAWSHHKRVGHY